MTESRAEPRYLVVSSDGHAGADVQGYRPYLESRWHEEFDRWAAAFHDPWVDLDQGVSGRRLGVSSAPQPVNWESGSRQRDLEADGIVGEILFPNTAPPFFPSGVITAPGPRTRDEYERRRAGLQAHNRWMVDFCAELPGRRAGMVQIFLNDVDDAVADIERMAAAGLTSVLLPLMEPGSGLPELYRSCYDPLWAACERLDITVTSHATAPGGPNDPDGLARGRAIAFVEVGFHAHRSLWHLIFGGVFERHPGLRFVMTEQGLGWVPGQLAPLDALYDAARVEGRTEKLLAGAAMEGLSLRPSEYFERNCYIGASFMMPGEVPVVDSIGADRIMWGSDYPHVEGTFPWSREALRAVFAGMPVEDCRKMIGVTAAQVYKLDLGALREAADRVGPTVDEIAEPLLVYPQVPSETNSPVFKSSFLAR